MVRNQLRHGSDEVESLDDSDTPTVALFLGECMGIRLVWRGEKDSHICFEVLCEDDGHWFVKQGYSSSYWMPELLEVLTAAQEWMKAHCDPDMHKGTQFGYRVHDTTPPLTKA